MKPVLLIDFGSTYTKVTAVDLDKEEIIATASSYTTVETDINNGFGNALAKLEAQAGKLDYLKRFACSSAAGGLKMISCGLVPDLTTKAAKTACLGAGAKLIKTYSFELTKEDIEEIDRLKPEIFLLTGGIDGGNSENILNNARLLAMCKEDFPIVIAGNRSAANECVEILSGKNVYKTENVMPSFNVLNITPVQNLIRDIFLEKIIEAKGMSSAQELIDSVMMPTPVALLKAMELLADGTKSESGIGEIFAVDLGGATTDVYSIAKGEPQIPTTVMKGLPEPYAKRTVEGDIGMRYSIHGIVQAVGIDTIAQKSGLSPERASEIIEAFASNTDKVPSNDEEKALDFALAYYAIETATIRHAGLLELYYTPAGETYLQTGKDLTSVEKIIITGGAAINSANPEETAKGAMFDMRNYMSLRPKDANILVDKKYILSAMGLLSVEYPEVALRIMKKEL